MTKVLIIDDEEYNIDILQEILEMQEYQVDSATDGESALEKLKTGKYDVAICDIKMPGMDGITVLRKAKEIAPETSFIMLSGHGTIETAVEAVKLGAYDFIEKPPDMNKLLITVRNAANQTGLVKETKKLKRKIHKSKLYPILGESPAIKEIKETIDKIAGLDVRVLITGENGTGKELVARWIHELSERAKKPFVEVNCAAIPSELIESELFGHEKGAFTSAIKQRIGKFEAANEGTLFLDEIGDMSLSAQAKVLRALQENKITRIGSNKTIKVDVRVIAATNKNLKEEIRKGNFREDLYHRLNVVPIHIPPLRERKEDIPILAERFLQDICEVYGFPEKKFDEKAMKLMTELPWTGNIRELKNAVERLAIFSDKIITEQDVKKYVSSMQELENIDNLLERFDSLDDAKEFIEKELIRKKLEENKGDFKKTAKALGISVEELQQKIKYLNL